MTMATPHNRLILRPIQWRRRVACWYALARERYAQNRIKRELGWSSSWERAYGRRK